MGSTMFMEGSKSAELTAMGIMRFFMGSARHACA